MFAGFLLVLFWPISVKWMPGSLASKWVFLDEFMLPIVPRNIFIILMSLKSFGLIASACKHCKTHHSSIPDQKFCLLYMTHITRDKFHLFPHLSNYKKKKNTLRTVFATEHKKYKFTSLHNLVMWWNNSRDEIVERAFKNYVQFRVNFHHPNKQAECKKCFR